MSTNMNEIGDKPAPAVVAEAKPATVSSPANAVPVELELRIAKAKQALLARAAIRVDDIVAGVSAAVALTHDPDLNGWVRRSLGFAAAHRGAAALMASQIGQLSRPSGQG